MNTGVNSGAPEEGHLILKACKADLELSDVKSKCHQKLFGCMFYYTEGLKGEGCDEW